MSLRTLVKFLYSEKVTKFCEISTLLLSTIHTDKSKVEISQNFMAFSEYMNFTNPSPALYYSGTCWPFSCHSIISLTLNAENVGLLKKTYKRRLNWALVLFSKKASRQPPRCFTALMQVQRSWGGPEAQYVKGTSILL